MKLKNIFAFLLLLVVGLQSLKAQEEYAVYTSANKTLTFYYDNLRNTRAGNRYRTYNGTANPRWYVWRNELTYVVFDESFANARPISTFKWFYGLVHLVSITGMEYLNTSEVTDMSQMFEACRSLREIDLSHFNTEKVKKMSLMFAFCSSLMSLDLSSFHTPQLLEMKEMFEGCEALTNLDMRNFNTEKIEDMSTLFLYCYALTNLDISSFDTRNVTKMTGMFSQCYALKSLDLSHFNTEKVTSMASMFSLCRNLQSLNLTGFNTLEVTDMSFMFFECNALPSLDLSSFNTQSVTDMHSMFSNCYCLTSLDLSNFNTQNVKNMRSMFYDCYALPSVDLSSFRTYGLENTLYMFYDCRSLNKIYVGDNWSTRSVTNSREMFQNCTNLVGDELTMYDPEHVDISYAHVDGGPDNPGYFSYNIFAVNGIYYRTTWDDNVKVTFKGVVQNGYSGKVNIPASIEWRGVTYNVKSIGELAFHDCSELTEVVIPPSVEYLDINIFEGCPSLQKITCGSPTPPRAYELTFSDYTPTVVVPSGCKPAYQVAKYWKNFNIEEMDHQDFQYGGIYYMDIGGRATAQVTYQNSDYGSYSGIVEIPEYVYNPVNDWPYKVTCIGERAFYRCPDLTSVTLPASIDRIESEAFVDAFLDASHSTMTCLAKRPPTISPYAFGSEIQSMTLYVMKGCKAAYEAHDVWKQFGNIVELPYHFQVRNAYYQITGENTVSVVNRDANYYSYWSQVTIPPTVTYEGVTYTVNKIANVAFFKCPELIRVIMPSTITSIGNRSFKDCTRLTSITIPENVQSIGLYAFDGCTGLNLGDIYCLATTPPSIDYTTFTESQYQGASLYVPYGCYGAYSQAPYWKNFCDIFELPIDPDAINEVTETVKETPWYDLSGRKVTNPQKGIYIKDGKKVLIK